MDMSFIYENDNAEMVIENGGYFPDTEDDINNLILLNDERIGSLPQLYAIALVWIKFHNEVFFQMQQLHPQLSQHVLFYESRRFVIAIYQNIWYNEVLPLVLSIESITQYKLASTRSCYDPTIEPTVSIEFSSAARHFHKFIHNNYKIFFQNGTDAEIPLVNLYNNMIGYDEFQGIIRGLLDRPWNTDKTASQVSNYLFSSDNQPSFDLRAFDIQAERDLGIATYCDALFYFNITNSRCIKKFSEFNDFIDVDVSNLFAVLKCQNI